MATQQYRSFVAGQWQDGGEPVALYNPSDLQDEVGVYMHAPVEVVNQAVRAAEAALDAWRGLHAMARSRLLDGIADGLVRRRDELALAIAREQGKPLRDALAEATRAADIFRYFASEAIRQKGYTYASIRPGVRVEVQRNPAGVVALVTPWNFPVVIPAWKTAAALAYGNTVVMKPSEIAPCGAWILADVMREAGLPAGVFNLVLGAGQAGAALVAHEAVAAVSFTGSVATGKRIAAAAAGKRIQLEMGGKNPLIVLDDADLDTAVACAIDGAFLYAGQRCTASSRIIVTEGIHAAFVERLLARTASLAVGHALDEATVIGPVVNAEQFEKNRRYAELARQEGGTVAGGRALSRPTRGHYFEPCLVTGLDNSATVCREEVFGPFACVLTARDYEHALAIANDTPFGLSSGLCTTSMKYAQHFKAHTKSGLASINTSTSGVDFHVPFGGNGASSYGPREQGEFAIEFFTTLRTVYIGD